MLDPRCRGAMVRRYALEGRGDAVLLGVGNGRVCHPSDEISWLGLASVPLSSIADLLDYTRNKLLDC